MVKLFLQVITSRGAFRARAGFERGKKNERGSISGGFVVLTVEKMIVPQMCGQETVFFSTIFTSNA
jgi:hypothetical protein